MNAFLKAHNRVVLESEERLGSFGAKEIAKQFCVYRVKTPKFDMFVENMFCDRIRSIVGHLTCPLLPLFRPVKILIIFVKIFDFFF